MQRSTVPDSRTQEYRAAVYSSLFSLTLLFILTVIPIRLPRSTATDVEVQPRKITSFHRPLVRRVLVVVLDGLGTHVAFQPGKMPNFHVLARSGALGIAQASFPTLTTTGITSIVTGRHPPPGAGFPGGFRPETQYDSVISRAHAAGLNVFVVGQQDWDSLFNGHGAQMTIIPYKGEPINYDARLLPRALEIMRDPRSDWNLLYLHLFDLDPTGHVHGLLSSEYAEKLDWVDAHLNWLVNAAGPEATVIITADHGQNDDGAHGGIEPIVREVPLLLLGARVKRGRFENVDQQDIAATVSALLGAPQPALSVGWPIFEALDLSPRERAEISLDVLRQRVAKWNATRFDWPWLMRSPVGDIKQVEHLVREGHFISAEKTARNAVKRIDNALERLSPSRWLGRGVLALGLLALASAFSFCWPESSIFFIQIAACLGVCRLTAIGITSLSLSLAPFSSLLSVSSSAGLFVLSLISGWKRRPPTSAVAWLAWWIALVTIACPFLVDISLWVWTAAWLIGLSAALPQLSRPNENFFSIALILAALCAATVFTSWTPSVETSVLRSLLPTLNLRRFGMPSWTHIEFSLWTVLAISLIWQTRRETLGLLNRRKNSAILYLGATTLIGGAISAAYKHPEFSEWVWALAIGVVFVFFFDAVSYKNYGLWLSLVGLAFCRTLIEPRDFCFLALATLVGWGLQDLPRPQSGIWRAGEILILALWSYIAPMGTLSVSKISVAEAYTDLGLQWHPHVMVTVLVLKYFLLAITPTLPLLADLHWKDLPGLFPWLGSMAGGNLGILWFEQAYMGVRPSNFVNEPSYEMLLWSAFFGWGVVIFWVVVRGSAKAARLRGRRESPEPALALGSAC